MTLFFYTTPPIPKYNKLSLVPIVLFHIEVGKFFWVVRYVKLNNILTPNLLGIG